MDTLRSGIPNLSRYKGFDRRGWAAVVRYRVGEVSHTLDLREPEQTLSADGLQAVWRWRSEEEGDRVWIELVNSGQAPIFLETADVLVAPLLPPQAPPGKWSVYQNGWQSWTPTFARHMGDGLYTDPGTPAYRVMHQPHWEAGREGNIISEWVTVIAPRPSQSPLPDPGRADPSLLVGFVTTADQLAEVQVQRDGLVTARCYFDGVLLAPGQSRCSEVLFLCSGPDPLALLEGWAGMTGREMKARVPLHPPTGWCTWYYFYGQNTATDVLENLKAIVHYDLPLGVILLDDGYQTAIGDWFSLDERKFPQGMEPVAQAVIAAGHRLGIWTAPFGATANSRLFAEHPHWVLRDEAGEPVVAWNHWGVDGYALDCTHPQVLAWLEEMFRRMRQEWGVQFFKVDFIFAAACAGQRHDPTATRAQALRQGLEAIRAGIGDDAFLLGCGAPLGPCIGLVDGMRVGPDVSLTWYPIWRHDLSMPSTQNGLRNSIARAPFHGRLWANDPDCLLVRQRGQDLNLVLNEMRTLTALIALLGGLTINSDHLPAIRPGRLKYLRQALPPTGVSARPLDLFQNEMPRLLVLPVEREWGQWWVAAAINWEDRTVETTLHLKDLEIPPGRYHVYHYWRRRYMGVADETITIRRHQPHETAVLVLKPVSEEPDLLATTFHVCAGAVEVEGFWRQASGVRVVLNKAGRQFGEVLFALPEGWRAAEAQVNGVRRDLRPVAPHVVALGLTLEGSATVEVGFEETGRAKEQ